MIRYLILAASLALCFGAAAPGVAVQVAGGTIAEVPAKTRGRLDLTGADALFLRCDKLEIELRIDYRKVSTLEYGQNVSRRYAAAIIISPVLLLSKSRRHFVTLGYLDADGRQQALVFRVEKGDIRAVLASLEARTGKRVEYQDNDARKGSKE
jgi:hypothetical protein